MLKKVFLFIIFLSSIGFSQNITIGTGSVLSEQYDEGNPILENDTDFLQFSQSVHVYNATQLASLPLYSTINSIGFKRFLTNTELFLSGRSATIKVYLKNSDRQTISNNKNFSEWIRGATLVYSNPNYSNADLPITQANVNFPCSGFQYMGNSIEVFVDARINGSPVLGYSQALRWYYDDTEKFQTNGLASGFTRFDNSVIYQASQRSYQLNINYTPSVPCFNGNAPVQTLASTTVPCAGNRVRLSLSNYQTGYEYQWFMYTNNILNPRLMENETNPTYDVPMLLNNQILNFYCRIACPQGAQFIYSEPVQITPTLIASFPYLETFDDDSPTADCWSQTADSRWFRDTANYEDNIYPFASNKFIYRNEILPKEITSPIINLTATSSTEFKQLVYRYSTDDWFDVLISKNLEPFTVVYSHNSTDNTVIDRSWATNTISLDNYDGERIRIQFRVTTTTNATVNAMTAIDEVLIEVKPQPCAQAPKKPAAHYQGSFGFVFFSGLLNSTVVMEYGLTGYTPGTQGTAGIGGIAGLYSGSSASFTNLQAASNYDVYVRERCEVPGLPGTYTYSPNSTVATFSTCNRSTVPYFENFEASAAPLLPDCTISVNESNGNNWVATNAPGFGFTSKAAQYNYNFFSEANAWFFTNRINLEKDKRYVLRYRYGITDQGYTEKLKVAYGTIATGAGMTDLLKDHASITVVGIKNSSITFTSNKNQGVFFGFNCYSDSQQDLLFIDDISVVEESYTLPVVETIQSFCSAPSPRVSNLVATGTNIKWYASLNSTVVMPQAIALNNNQTYYVTQTIDGFESSRVAVKIFIQPRPTVLANQTVCAGKTLADLQVTGINLKWYSAPTGGILLPTTTVVSNTTYYVSQTVAGTGTCESTRATVNVTITSVTPITPEIVTACRGYWWSANKETYTQSGTYTTITNSCELKTLVLTINETPAPVANTTQTVCGLLRLADLNITGTNLRYFDDNNNRITSSVTSIQPNYEFIYVDSFVNGCASNSLKIFLTYQTPIENITTISSCGRYYWANTGQSYTQSGVYSGTTSNCLTQKLNLTITPSSDNVTTATACDSYTWNNQTYNQSGIYTGTTANCITEKLNLTITPSSINTTTATACDSYIWNNQTYNQSGIYTGTTANCITEKLNLTITPSSINTITATACDNYTWNNQTYNQSGIYTGTTTNCITEKLNLTITPSSINTITATACDNYTWNNQTYNQSGIYTGTTANCITEKLNLTITPSTIYFADADNDGFGNPTITQLACSQPIGYVANSNDCNDANANINPTAPEICDGIDNNCNGQIDEGCNVIATQLVGATCGAVMQNTYLTIAATQIVGATGYRFRVTNLTTNSVQIIDRVPFFWFQFNTVNDLTYNTNYSIEVMVQIAGIWSGNYGTACLVTTPSISGTGPKAATLVSSQCGSTLASISTTFGSNNLSGVTGYRFRLTNTNDGTVQVLDRNVHWLSLNMFQIFNYGVTYTVEVAIKTTGTTYSAYGNICNITAPAIPSIQNVCDTQIPKSFINFGTKSSIAVTSYKFEITNTLTNSVQTLIKPVHYFNFKELSGIMPNTVYSIRVAVKTGLTFSEFSVACNITSPLANREIFAQGVLQESITENFEVLVLPNPFTDNFALNITSSSTEKIEIKIFDMIGKLLESRELQFDDIQNFSIGNNYPSGVYSVIVTQNDNFKTIRVIKR